MKKVVTVLGIETSCDETAVALVRCRASWDNFEFKVMVDLVHSQVPIHRRTGGVVPEVAAREHAVRLPLLLQALGKRYGKERLRRVINAIAVTSGPGLITSLLVGVEIARTMSSVWDRPLVAVNHLEGHLYANLLQAGSRTQNAKRKTQNFVFPLLALVVSGGHTELVLMKKHLSYELLGSTRDDAAGECFDKTARLLGLPYPGGPALSRLATRGRRDAIAFPRPMLKDMSLDMSFAGLKTAVAVYLQKHPKTKPEDVAASVEAAIVETLVSKTLRAVELVKPKMVLLAGGVAANLPLRRELRATLETKFPNIAFLEPALAYTTDNAAMIAAAGAVRYLYGKTASWQSVRVDPHLPLR